MTKNRGYAMMSGFLGAFLIATGMLLKNVVTYAPTIGWIGGGILFLIASYFAVKSKNQSTKTTP